MSQNLTQPDEIDQILKAMAAQGMQLDALHPEESQPIKNVKSIKINGGDLMADSSCAQEDAKSTSVLCNSHPYVWSM